MRDSTNRGWDEQFVDQAWGHMRQLLDEELPAAAAVPRRRAGVMLLVFLLGLVFGGLSIVYLANRPKIGYFPIPERAVAERQEPGKPAGPAGRMALPADEPREQRTVAGNTKAIEIADQPSAPLKEKTDVLTASDQDAGQTTISPTSRKDVQLPPANELPVLTNVTTPAIQEIIPPFLPAPPAETPPLKNLAQQEQRTAFPVMDTFSPLPGVETPDGVTVRDTFFAETFLLPPVSAVAAADRLQWGAELGGNYYQDPGFFGGLQLSYSLGSRWGLQGGLHFGQIVSGLDDARRAANMSFATEEASADPGTNLNTNRDQTGINMPAPPNYYDINLRLQQLSAPVLATYQLSRKWQLGAGVQMHYLLAARRPAQEIVPTDNAVAPSFSAYDRALTGLAASGNTVDTGLFQDWNLGAVLGTAFRPSDRWSVNLRFQYGFFNWLESDRFLVTPTNLQLSAVYLISE